MKFAVILSVFCLSCFRYELKPGASSVELVSLDGTFLRLIEQNKHNENSGFSKCRSLGTVESDPITVFGDEDRNAQWQKIENDVRNKAFEKGANVVGFGGVSRNALFHCENLSALLAIQKEIDDKAVKEKDAAKEKWDRELFTKPHYWVLCGSNGSSNTLPSVREATVQGLKPEAFATESECADRAWITNEVAKNFDVRCTCKFVKMAQ